MTNYTKGRAHEYRIAKKLRAEGWTVLRTAGSHGFVDLVAIKITIPADNSIHWFVNAKGEKVFGGIYGPEKNQGEIKLIQCKAGKSSKQAIKAVVDSDIKRWNGLYSVSVEVI